MSKFINDLVYDQALNYIKNNAGTYIICDGQPADYTAATNLKSDGGNKLGETGVDDADFTVADGDASGRKITIAAQANIAIDEAAAGDHSWDHIALVDDANGVLLLADPLANARTVQNGDSVSPDPFDYELPDVT